MPNQQTEIIYRGYRLRYKFTNATTILGLTIPETWFVNVRKIYPYEGYPYLGSHWFKAEAECVDWGKRLIDATLSNGDTYSIVFEPLHPDLVVYNPDSVNIKPLR
jgi:hypothetical protein